MKNKNKAEQYFHQKEFSLAETLSLIVVGISLIVMTFVRGGIPMGTPFLLTSVVLFCIFRSFKIKDSDIDQLLEQMIRENDIERSENVVECYDSRDALLKKRKEGKIVSSKYCITNIKFSSEATTFTVYRLDLLDRSAKKDIYTVAFGEKISLIEETLNTNVGSLEAPYIEFNGIIVPVTLNEYNTAELVRKICDKHRGNDFVRE